MRSWIDTLIVIVSIPVACTGGVLALLLTGMNFSVSAAMGFISIFGIAIQDAILVVTYFQRLRDVEGHSVELAAREAAEKRFRPVLMTTLVATLGLLPAAISNGIGAQTQKPLAIVVIGGSLILAILTRVLQPPLLVLAHRSKGEASAAAGPPLVSAARRRARDLGNVSRPDDRRVRAGCFTVPFMVQASDESKVIYCDCGRLGVGALRTLHEFEWICSVTSERARWVCPSCSGRRVELTTTRLVVPVKRRAAAT